MSATALVLAAVLAQAGPDPADARMRALADRLKCWCPTCGWGKSLGDCDCGHAKDSKKQIREWFREGKGEEEVVALILAQIREEQPKEPHPERVLGVPERKGLLNHLFYAAPFIFLGVGAVFVVFFLARRALRGPGGAPPQEASVDPALRERIEAEVKRVGWE